MNNKAWCSQHQMHPDKCFVLHNPNYVTAKGSLSADELRERVIREHVRLQEQRFSKTIVEASKRFQQSKRDTQRRQQEERVKEITTPDEGIFPHTCTEPGCTYTVMFDDEPKCYKHSPDSGSSVRGYSARREAAEAQEA